MTFELWKERDDKIRVHLIFWKCKSHRIKFYGVSCTYNRQPSRIFHFEHFYPVFLPNILFLLGPAWFVTRIRFLRLKGSSAWETYECISEVFLHLGRMFGMIFGVHWGPKSPKKWKNVFDQNVPGSLQGCRTGSLQGCTFGCKIVCLKMCECKNNTNFKYEC